VNALQFFADSIHTQYFVADFLQVKCNFRWKTAVGNVRCSSYAHWKARSGLTVSVNRTFIAGCYGWGGTSEYRLKIGVFAPTWSVFPKISGRRGRPNQPFFLSEIDEYFMWGKNMGRNFLSFSHNARVWQTNGRTDRQKCLGNIPCVVLHAVAG